MSQFSSSSSYEDILTQLFKELEQAYSELSESLDELWTESRTQFLTQAKASYTECHELITDLSTLSSVSEEYQSKLQLLIQVVSPKEKR